MPDSTIQTAWSNRKVRWLSGVRSRSAERSSQEWFFAQDFTVCPQVNDLSFARGEAIELGEQEFDSDIARKADSNGTGNSQGISHSFRIDGIGERASNC